MPQMVRRDLKVNLLKRKNWAVFISGQGSNLRALLHSPDLLNIKLVVSSRANAAGLLFAKRAGIPCKILSNPIDWTELNFALKKAEIECIFLLGFMRLLPKTFIDNWRQKILNLHPSLLPKYVGLKSVERAYNEQSDVGVTVHEVIPEMDAGPIVMQKKVLAGGQFTGLSLEDCEFKVHIAEQNLIRRALLKWK